MLNAPGIEQECWVTIRYERLPEFCFGCGVIGHGLKDCNMNPANEKEDQNKREFGSWLRFQGFFNQPKREGVPPKDQNHEETRAVVEEEMGIPMDTNIALEFEKGKEIASSPVSENQKGVMENESPDNESSSSQLKRNDLEMEGVEVVGSEGSPSSSGSKKSRTLKSAKKKSKWKRRARFRDNEINLNVSPSKKRKASGDLKQHAKRVRIDEFEGMDLVKDEINLAVAGDQPCLQP